MPDKTVLFFRYVYIDYHEIPILNACEILSPVACFIACNMAASRKFGC